MSEARYTDRPYDATLGHIVYALYAAGFFTFVAFIISGAICLAKRDDVRGTILEGHFTWIIRTFLWSLLAWAVTIVLFVTIIGIPLAWLLGCCAYVWSVYRVVVGWLKLAENRPIPDPEGWF